MQYLVCIHVKSPSDVAHFQRSTGNTAKTAGEIHCAIPGEAHDVNDVLLLDESHVKHLIPSETAH